MYVCHRGAPRCVGIYDLQHYGAVITDFCHAVYAADRTSGDSLFDHLAESASGDGQRACMTSCSEKRSRAADRARLPGAGGGELQKAKQSPSHAILITAPGRMTCPSRSTR